MKVKGAFPVRWKPQDGADGEGVTIQSQTIKYAKHTSGTSKPTSGWSTSIPTVENGLYLWTWTHILYSDGNATDMYSVSRMGIDGKGIKNSVVTYSQQETNVSPESITDWGAFPETLYDGHWLYTRTVITYSEGTDTTTSYSVSQVGVGSYYAGTEEYYALSASRTEAPEGYIAKGQYGKDDNLVPTGDWSQERPSADTDKPYIWNFSISRDSRDNSYVTDVICIGNFAKGITSIVETYAISAYGTVSSESDEDYPEDIAETDWTNGAHAAAPTEDRPYQWNRTVTTYNDGSPETHYHVSAVKGADGKGAVYIDLDNENDSMLYDGAGNLVSGSVTSNIVLYANGVKVASQPTFSIKEKSSAVTASISGSVLTVSGCTANSGYVIVKCTYQDTEYTARFTVKRLVGTDKYEIILSHNAITHNTDTDVLSASSVSVSVYRTAQNGTRTKVSSLSTYGLTIRCEPNGLLINTFNPTYSSGSATFDIDSSWDSVDVVLIKDSKELDRESVPIGKVKNGPKGEGAMLLDLDNENDTMLYDGTNTTCLSGNVVSQATLYQGTTKIESGITWSCETNNCTATISESGLVTVTELSSSSGSVTVYAQYGGTTYSAMLTLKKLRGVDKYELVCTPNAITYNSDSGTLSSSSIKVEVYKTDANGTRSKLTTLPTDLKINYIYNGTTEYTSTYSNGAASVTVKSSATQYVIMLKNSASLILDSETIPICKVENGAGEPGANAKSIYKNSFDKPATPTGSAPSGWSDDIVEETPIDVKHQGNWIKDTEGWHVAPRIGNSQTDTQTIQFITNEENQRVYYRVKVNIPTADDVFIGKVDAVSPTSSYNNRLYGLNKDTGDVYVDVATPGVHFICIVYKRVASTSSELSHYAKYKLGVMPTWKSDALTFNADGSVATWSVPYKVTTEAEEEAAETRPNLLLQTSFLSTQMDKWVTKGGATTSGLDGHSAYVGTNSDTENYKELLKQIIYDPTNTAPADCKVRPSTWYTLSFLAKSGSVGTSEQLATYLYPDADQSTHTYIDISAGRYVDGRMVSATNGTDNCTLWKLTTEWTRHWMAFKTASHLSDTAKQQLLFRLLASAGTVYICMPKLERGIGPTAYCTNEDDTINRAADENGFPNDRGIWVESPTESYVWNEERRDYVSFMIPNGEFKRFFVRRKGLTVPNGESPAEGGTDYWEQGHTVRTLVSNTAVIDNASIGGFTTSNDIFKSNNGRLTLDGLKGVIQMFHEDGYSWQILDDGRQVLGVYTDDNTKGKHIQLDPEAKEIRIYDDGGVCVSVFSGETIDSLDSIFGTSSGTLVLSNNSKTLNLSPYTNSNADNLWTSTNEATAQLTLASFETTGGTRLKVIGTITATAYTTTTPKEQWYEESSDGEIQISPGGQSIDGSMSIRNYAYVNVLVKTYTDESMGTLKETKQITTIASNGQGAKSLSFETAIDLSSGYHVLMVGYSLRCPGWQSTQTTATSSWKITSAVYDNDIYLSRLFANGAAYGSSVNNFFAAMNIDGRMHIKAATLRENDNILYGMELSTNGLSTLFGDAKFRQMVVLGLGNIYYTSLFQWGNYTRGMREDTLYPALSRTDTGTCKITYPSTWTQLSLNAAYLHITVIGSIAGTTAMVTEKTATYCVVKTYKGTSLADSLGFYIKFEYLLP